MTDIWKCWKWGTIITQSLSNMTLFSKLTFLPINGWFAIVYYKVDAFQGIWHFGSSLNMGSDKVRYNKILVYWISNILVGNLNSFLFLKNSCSQASLTFGAEIKHVSVRFIIWSIFERAFENTRNKLL